MALRDLRASVGALAARHHAATSAGEPLVRIRPPSSTSSGRGPIHACPDGDENLTSGRPRETYAAVGPAGVTPPNLPGQHLGDSAADWRGCWEGG